MFQSLQRILYFVSNPAVAVEWFSQFFDVPVTCLNHPHDCYLRLETQEIHFQKDERTTLGGLGEQVACWEVEDVDAAVLRALELDARLIRGPLVRPDNTLLALVRAPFGSVIGLTGSVEYKTAEIGEELSLGAYVVRGGWLRRVLRVTGEVQADLDYNARGGFTLETEDSGRGHLLRINGKEVSAGTPTPGEWIYLPFHLPGDSRIPGRLEVLLQSTWSGLKDIEELRLRIAGTVLYEEKGGNPTMERSELPIPAPPPSPKESTMPRPARGPAHGGGSE